MLSSTHSRMPAGKRLAIVAGTASVTGAAAYAFAKLLALAACQTGACPIAAVPVPLVGLFALVGAWAAWRATAHLNR